MHSQKQSSPQAREAIQAYLANGGQITRVPPSTHGECVRRKGIQYGAKDPERVKNETFANAEEEKRRREWINEQGGLKLVRELGVKPPWED